MVPRLVTKTVLLLVILGLLFFSGAADDLRHISNSCTKTNYSYTIGSVFQANLNYTLLSQLSPKASLAGFSNFSTGTGVDQVYALYYCRGDVDANTCQDCVKAAAEKILQVCKFMKEAIIWFEGCTLRYANRSIFSIDEEFPPYLYSNSTSQMGSYYLDPYQQIFDSTMETLIRQAAYTNGFLKAFATKEVNFSSFWVLRGLAQCTPDIVGPKCFRCLTSALGQWDHWANTMIFMPSCLIRYDLYPLPPTFSTSPSRSGRVILIVVLCVGILLLIVGGIWIWRRFYSSETEESSNGLQCYSNKQLKKMTKKFSDKLGEGGFGEVYRGKLKDGTVVAVKVLSKKDDPQFRTEKTVLERVSHKNLVKLIGYCEEGRHLALICECMTRGDLRELLSGGAVSLSWIQRLQIAIDIAEGLCYLHDECNPHIVHRDVKPANVLLNENLQAKVADFGFSKIFPDESVTTIKTRVVNSHGYTAPEYLTSGLLNKNVDVYSFGVVLLELITGRTPKGLFNLVEWVEDAIQKKEKEKLLDEKLTTEVNHESVWNALELARSCTNLEASDRPEMSKIITKLNQCKNMELENGIGSSSPGSTPNETRITMVPEAR